MDCKSFKQLWKRALSFSLVTVMTLSLAACNKGEEKSREELPEYTYIPEYIELKEDESYWQAVLEGDFLYNLVTEWDQETGTSSSRLMKYPIEGSKLGEGIEVIGNAGSDNMQNFLIDKDENVYLLMTRYPVLEEGEEPDEDYWKKRRTFLKKFDAQGQQVFEQDITEQLNEDEEHEYMEAMCIDNEGRIYTLSNDWIRLFDKEGKYAGKISGSVSYFSALGRGKDGKVYACYYDNNSGDNSYVLAEVDFAGKKLGDVHKNFIRGNNSNGSLAAGVEKDFLIQDGTDVYEYDLATDTAEKLFNWIDCDINGNYVDKLAASADGRLLVLLNDWNSGGTEMAYLTKKKTSEVPVKEIVTIGSLYEDYRLRESVVAFNKSNDKYRVKIKTYMNNNEWSEEARKDAITNLNNDIISGTNCPDIMNLSSLNIKQLAAKGVFEDLTSYLEKSSELSKDDYLENILDSLTINGVLVTIPYSFNLQTVMGKTADVGDKMGWTLEDMIAFCEKHPDAQLFDYAQKATILSYCLNYNEAAYINWETGECKFDSPEFKQLLEFVNKFPEEFDWESNDKSTPEKLAAGEVLLNSAYINGYDDMQYSIAQFNGEAVTCIGFPDVSGGSGCQMNLQEIYGISSTSQHKEAAWAFIEKTLSKEPDYRFNESFSTRKSYLAKQREEATKITYVTDENGDPVLDENGNPIEEGSSTGSASIISGGGAGWSYTYHRTTNEEADLVDELIAVAVPASMNGDSQLLGIITEEAEGYFKGQKSVDDVAGIIQSRIQVYVNENR